MSSEGLGPVARESRDKEFWAADSAEAAVIKEEVAWKVEDWID